MEDFQNSPISTDICTSAVLCMCVTVHRSMRCVQKRTTLDLGSVDSYKFYYIPPAPPVSTIFMDLYISLLHPTSPPYQ